MDLIHGYKSTAVGLIPQDWHCKALGTFAAVSSGGTPSRQHSEYWCGTIPWITTSQINFGLITSAREFITSAGLANSAARIYPVNTLLMAMYGQGKTRGKVATLGLEAATNQACAAILPDRTVHPQFLFHWLAGRYRKIRELSNTGNQENLNSSLIRAIPCALPPTLAEQKAIAEALSDVDALIESLQQLIAKKRQIKLGAMQELLTGKRRLPGFEGTFRTKQTDIGAIPEDWTVYRMGTLGQTLIGLTYSPEDVHPYGTLVLRSSNIQNERLVFKDNVFVEMDIPMRAITQEGDILICVRNGSRDLIGKCALIDEATAGSAFGAFMSVFRSRHNRYLTLQLRSHVIQRQIGETLGATINQITSRNLNSFQVPLPPTLDEQAMIADVIFDMQAEIDGLHAKLHKTRQIKLGMMRNLLTGKIRLK